MVISVVYNAAFSYPKQIIFRVKLIILTHFFNDIVMKIQISKAKWTNQLISDDSDENKRNMGVVLSQNWVLKSMKNGKNNTFPGDISIYFEI